MLIRAFVWNQVRPIQKTFYFCNIQAPHIKIMIWWELNRQRSKLNFRVFAIMTVMLAFYCPRTAMTKEPRPFACKARFASRNKGLGPSHKSVDLAPTYLVPNILAAIAGTSHNILTVYARLLNGLCPPLRFFCCEFWSIIDINIWHRICWCQINRFVAGP